MTSSASSPATSSFLGTDLAEVAPARSLDRLLVGRRRARHPRRRSGCRRTAWPQRAAAAPRARPPRRRGHRHRRRSAASTPCSSGSSERGGRYVATESSKLAPIIATAAKKLATAPGHPHRRRPPGVLAPALPHPRERPRDADVGMFLVAVAEVKTATTRSDEGRAGDDAQRRHHRRRARHRPHVLQGVGAREVARPRRRGIFAGDRRHVQPPAPARPTPATRCSTTSTPATARPSSRSTAPSGHCTRGPSPRACAGSSTCSTTCRTRCRPTCAGAARAALAHRRAARHPHPGPCAQVERGPAPAALRGGVRPPGDPGTAPARAHPAQRDDAAPGAGGRHPRRVRRPAAVRADGRPARGRGDARRARWPARCRCTGCCRARSAPARRWSRCARCSPPSTPADRRRCWPPPRSSRRSTTARSPRCSATSPRAGCSGGADDATRVALLTGSQSAAARRKRAARRRESATPASSSAPTRCSRRTSTSSTSRSSSSTSSTASGSSSATRCGARGSMPPHVLVMTATPIPRTVAMTVFGDLETSTLRELPAGRAPITTHVVPEDQPGWMERTWARVAEEVRGGRQAYVVCPRIGDDDVRPTTDADLRAEATERRRRPAAPAPTPRPLHERVCRARPPRRGAGPGGARPSRSCTAGCRRRQGRRHGALPARRDSTCSSRRPSSRSGVDVPNASVMVVMDADRFGVSQLHQLRGRDRSRRPPRPLPPRHRQRRRGRR